MFDFCVFFKSNHDINFIFFNVKTFAFVKHIINYVIEKNCNQYQRIMKFAFICKTGIDVVKNSNNESNSNNFVLIANIEKFVLRTYNRFIHNREINDFFIANYLKKLSKYYIYFLKMKRISLNLFRRIFAFI